MSAVGSKGEVFSYERGTHVGTTLWSYGWPTVGAYGNYLTKTFGGLSYYSTLGLRVMMMKKKGLFIRGVFAELLCSELCGSSPERT